MFLKRILHLIGITEISLGLSTLAANLTALILFTNTKSFNVLVFVLTTSLMSTLIGIGLLRGHKSAYQALLYFSSVIVLTKILILGGIIGLNGALETTVPGPIKNAVSILYHGFVIAYLTRRKVKVLFEN